MTAARGPVSGQSWYEATSVPDPGRGALTFDLDVDVCVIGAGFAGLTTARELARRGWSVAVLEAHRVAWNASGRNCGFVLPGFAEDIAAIVERVGLARARELWALADSGLAYVRETIRETAMPGVEPVPGWLYVAKFVRDPRISAEAALLADTFGAAVEEWPAEQVRGVLRTHLYFNALHYRDAFHVHPLNYALGLAAAAEQAGARIFEGTPALSIDPAGVRKRVTTPAARVRAAQIVLAGNVHLGNLVPRLSATLMPISTYLATTAALGDRLRGAVGYSGAVSDTPWADSHYRVVGGDRLLWSGGMTTWSGDARRYRRRLARDILRVFPQLGAVEIEHVWTGTLGRTVHRMPQIGELGPGLWVASGFGGHGFNTTAMAGNLIARAIAEGDGTWRLFRPYELVWAGGASGRMLIQVGYATKRMRDLAKARFSRRKGELPASTAPAETDRPAEAPPQRRSAAAKGPRRKGRDGHSTSARRPKSEGAEAAELVSADFHPPEAAG